MNPTPAQDELPTADVGEQRVARVYAEALLNAAEKQRQSDEVLDELDSLVRDVFTAGPELETFLSSAAVGRDRKAHLINQVIGPRSSATLRDFLLVLNDHDRLGLLRPMLAAAREIRDQRARRVRVLVRSAVPLTDEQGERIKNQAREVLHLEPILVARVDPELLAGLVVQVGDWLFDGSLRTQIDNLRNQLIARGSHEIQSRRDRFSSPDGD